MRAGVAHPTGRRLHRHDIDWHPQLTEAVLAATYGPGRATRDVLNSPWLTPWRHARHLAIPASPPAAPTLGQRLADALGWDHLPALTTQQQEEIDTELAQAQALTRRVYGLNQPDTRSDQAPMVEQP